jgi:hypothetical protein
MVVISYNIVLYMNSQDACLFATFYAATLPLFVRATLFLRYGLLLIHC